MTDTELELPQGWVYSKIDSICDVKGRVGWKGYKKSDLRKNGYYVMGATHLGFNFKLDLSKPVFISKEKFDESPEIQISEGDILLAQRGSIGKIAIVDYKINGTINPNTMILKNISIENVFLLYLLSSPKYKKIILSNNNSSTIPMITQKFIKNLEISIPPLNEQKRIVSKIEELFAKIDSAKQSLEYTKLQLEQYIESLLNSVFERNYDICKIKDIASVKGGKRLPKGHTFSDTKTSHPYLRVTDFQNFGINESALKYITDETFKKIKRYTIFEKDVYISIAGNGLGQVGIVPSHLNGSNLTENSAKLTDISIHQKYLCYALYSPKSKLQIERAITSTAQPKLALFRIQDIDISLPTTKEQEQIVSQIEQGFSLIENTTQIVESTLQNLQTMKMSVLKQAFEGKLVPQDPNDEPASVLLEKIKLKN